MWKFLVIFLCDLNKNIHHHMNTIQLLFLIKYPNNDMNNQVYNKPIHYNKRPIHRLINNTQKGTNALPLNSPYISTQYMHQL